MDPAVAVLHVVDSVLFVMDSLLSLPFPRRLLPSLPPSPPFSPLPPAFGQPRRPRGRRERGWEGGREEGGGEESPLQGGRGGLVVDFYCGGGTDGFSAPATARSDHVVALSSQPSPTGNAPDCCVPVCWRRRAAFEKSCIYILENSRGGDTAFCKDACPIKEVNGVYFD